jgi:outer membrane lipoprotein SlyB
MAGKNKAVFGIYRSSMQAEDAVDRLVANGFASDNISVLLPDNTSSRQFAHQKNTKAPEGTATGATTGGVIGGTLGLLAGIGAGGAAGGLLGALIGAGIPEYEAKRFEGRIKEGGVLLSVHCDTSQEIDRAKELVKRTGAEDISSSSEASAPHPAGTRA